MQDVSRGERQRLAAWGLAAPLVHGRLHLLWTDGAGRGNARWDVASPTEVHVLVSPERSASKFSALGGISEHLRPKTLDPRLNPRSNTQVLLGALPHHQPRTQPHGRQIRPSAPFIFTHKG